MLRSITPRGPSTPRSTGCRPGTPSPRSAGPPRSRARPGAQEAPRGSRCDDFAEVGSGRRRGGRRRGSGRGAAPPARGDRPSTSTALRGRGATPPVRGGAGPPADGPRAGAGPRRVPRRPGRSHSGWLISKEIGPAPRRSVAGDAGRPPSRRRPSPRGRAPAGRGPTGPRGGEPDPSAREGMADGGLRIDGASGVSVL